MPQGGDERPLAISPPKAKVARSNRVGSASYFKRLDASATPEKLVGITPG
jgi:hypothetical protein